MKANNSRTFRHPLDTTGFPQDDVSNACRQISWREGRKQNVWTLPPGMGSTATNLSVCTVLGMSRDIPLSWAAPNATNNQAVGGTFESMDEEKYIRCFFFFRVVFFLCVCGKVEGGGGGWGWGG